MDSPDTESTDQEPKPVKVTCACGKRILAPRPGVTVLCPKCQEPVKVPGAPGAAPSSAKRRRGSVHLKSPRRSLFASFVGCAGIMAVLLTVGYIGLRIWQDRLVIKARGLKAAGDTLLTEEQLVPAKAAYEGALRAVHRLEQIDLITRLTIASRLEALKDPRVLRYIEPLRKLGITTERDLSLKLAIAEALECDDIKYGTDPDYRFDDGKWVCIRPQPAPVEDLPGFVTYPGAGDSAPRLPGIIEERLRAAERARRWAILVGVNRYEDQQGIGSLRYCVQDVNLLSEVLTGPLGGFDAKNVLAVTDDAANPMHRPTYSNLVTMIPRWLEDVGPEDDVLIAFSGHGLEEDGQCYLLPGDAKRGNLRLTSVSVPQLRRWLEACKAKRKLLILDACHSGAGKAVEKMSEAMKREIETGRGSLRLASCDTDQKSSEDEALGHGVFTHYLATCLRGKGDSDGDGRVTVDEAHQYVARETVRWAREHGLRQDPIMSGRVVGGMFTLCYAPRRTPGQPGYVALARMAELFLRIQPAHAVVTLDGDRIQLREDGRVALSRALPGRHVLVASKTGFARLETVLDIPPFGAEGTIDLAPTTTRVTLWRTDDKVDGKLVKRAAAAITLQLADGRAVTYRKGSYHRLEEREVAEGASRAEVYPKAAATVAGAIGAGLISRLPEGTLTQQSAAFCKRWEANLTACEKAKGLYAKGSPELGRLGIQRKALSLQAAELAKRIHQDIGRGEAFLKALVKAKRAEDSPVVFAAIEEVRIRCAMAARLLAALPAQGRSELLRQAAAELKGAADIVARLGEQGRASGSETARLAQADLMVKQCKAAAIVFALPEQERDAFVRGLAQKGPLLWLDRTVAAPGDPVLLCFVASPEFTSRAWVSLSAPSQARRSTYQYTKGQAWGTMTFQAPTQRGLCLLRAHSGSRGAAGKWLTEVRFKVGIPTGLGTLP